MTTTNRWARERPPAESDPPDIVPEPQLRKVSRDQTAAGLLREVA